MDVNMDVVELRELVKTGMVVTRTETIEEINEDNKRWISEKKAARTGTPLPVRSQSAGSIQDCPICGNVCRYAISLNKAKVDLLRGKNGN